MKRTHSVVGWLGGWVVAAAALVAPTLTLPSAAETTQQPKPADAQDFVFLGESRPVLIRLHVRVDGKPVQEAWDGFMKHLFAHLDINRDGILSQQEVERAPTVEQLATGIPASALGGLGGFGGGASSVSLAD